MIFLRKKEEKKVRKGRKLHDNSHCYNVSIPCITWIISAFSFPICPESASSLRKQHVTIHVFDWSVGWTLYFT